MDSIGRSENHNPEALQPFPKEITFKVIYRNIPFLDERIRNLLHENEIDAELYQKESRNAKFLSITITAEFLSENQLNQICHNLKLIEGFFTMF